MNSFKLKLLSVTLLIIALRAENYAGDVRRYVFDNTSVEVSLPEGVTVSKYDTTVFCTYSLKTKSKIFMVVYVGDAPGFPSKYSTSVPIRKYAVNGLTGRIVNSEDRNKKNTQEILLMIPYGHSLGYLHAGSIQQGEKELKLANEVVASIRAGKPYVSDRSSTARWFDRLRKKTLFLLHPKTALLEPRDDIYNEVSNIVDKTGKYPVK